MKVLALISDIFFSTKVEEVAKHLTIPLVLVDSAETLISKAREGSFSLVIIDLNFDAAGSPELVRTLKQVCSPNPVRILAFLSHVQTSLEESARRAGADAVVPRSYFSKHLSEILKGNFKIESLPTS